MRVTKNNPIAIIGGGAFGLSTAFELSQQGYKNITVFEKDSEIPSRWSAANDLNKIMRAEYEDPWYTQLGVEAAKKWQTPLYAPYFHRVGYLNCVSGAGTQKATNSMKSFKAASEAHPEINPWVSSVSNRQELRDICWQFNQGEMPGWKGYFNRYDGYVHSANALRGIHRAARSNGVQFLLGDSQGAVQEIVYEGAGPTKKSIGVKTKDGQFHAASLVIVATGAAASNIVPEIGSQVSAKSWSVAHIRLTDDETAALRGIPVTYARDLGFFFEPDPRTNLLKLCPMGGGFINTNPTTGVSEAPEDVQRFVPPEDERKMRELLRQTLPYLADRPLVEKTLCWFADTSDSNYIVDYLPETSSTVIVLSGDSGHGFKMFPIVGSWVKNLIDTPEGRQTEKRWQWRESKPNDGSASQDDVSWRVGDVQELKDIVPSVARL
ncbi:hypothetical protein E8E13_011209 [Curvularia kusanoi]|uniref:FAD dependent oxidoreductase domain-containing protein n=1 Tax=Curvularia kusanoi TaxID=90978 RepID=A0A9P4WAG8_CURKU|nr:hypothetical protein E8E13_011209 [Curvularia kusanoi]